MSAPRCVWGVLGNALLALLGKQEEGWGGPCPSQHRDSEFKEMELHEVSFPDTVVRNREPGRGGNTRVPKGVEIKQRFLHTVRSGSGTKSKGKFKNLETTIVGTQPNLRECGKSTSRTVYGE